MEVKEHLSLKELECLECVEKEARRAKRLRIVVWLYGSGNRHVAGTVSPGMPELGLSVQRTGIERSGRPTR
jgi:hypothetical protein